MESAENNKYIFYVLGGPGVGKSTIMRFIKGEEAASISGTAEFEFLLNKISMLSFEAVTIDSIRDQMPQPAAADLTHPHPEKTEGQIDEYKQIRRANFYNAFNRAASIYMDDHGDLAQQDRSFLEAAKQAGYKIILIDAAFKPEDYMRMQYALAKQRGYNPMQHMEWAMNIFKTSEKAFSDLMPMADNAFILERTGTGSFTAYNARKLSEAQREALSDKVGWKNVRLGKLKALSRQYEL